MTKTTGKHLRIRVKDAQTGKEGWMKADILFEAIARIIIEDKKKL